MKDNIQPCEVIESNLLDPTKETDLKTEFAEIREIETEFAIPNNLTQYFHNKVYKEYISKL